VQTVKPYSLKSGLEIRREELLDETCYDPRESLRLALSVLDAGDPAVLCSHGKVLPALIDGVCEQRYDGRAGDTHLRKGAFAVLHHAAGRVVGVERYIV
jgi:8-oxo-dGTP diphosphatase